MKAGLMGRRVQRRAVLGVAVLALALVGATAAVALSFGSAAVSLKGTFTGVVKYTFIGGAGSAQVSLAGMTNPTASVSFNSITNGEWTVTKTSHCVRATLDSGSGEGGASVTAHKPPDNVDGQIIRTGGKPMGAGNYLEACAL